LATASRRRPLTDSPFDTLERTFTLLTTGPRPLSIDGSALEGLPDRQVPLDELKSRLLHPSTPFAVRDAAIGELVSRAQQEGGRWSVGLAGVLLPGLRRITWSLVRTCPGKAADIESETLAAFLAAVAKAETGRPRLAARLCWLARAGAERVCRSELAERAGPGTDPVSAAPPRPWGHPDLVLARAVRKGVIGAEDAELIGSTRLGVTPLATAAERLGLGYWACHKRRRRAETALVAWVTSDDYSPFDIVQRGDQSPCSSGGGRPRHRRPQDRQPGKRRSNPTRR
jgi:hypothetical protein